MGSKQATIIRFFVGLQLWTGVLSEVCIPDLLGTVQIAKLIQCHFTFWVHSCSEFCKGPSGCTIEQAWKARSRQFRSQALTNKETHLHWLQMLSRAVTAVTAATAVTAVTVTVPSHPSNYPICKHRLHWGGQSSQLLCTARTFVASLQSMQFYFQALFTPRQQWQQKQG